MEPWGICRFISLSLAFRSSDRSLPFGTLARKWQKQRARTGKVPRRFGSSDTGSRLTFEGQSDTGGRMKWASARPGAAGGWRRSHRATPDARWARPCASLCLGWSREDRCDRVFFWSRSKHLLTVGKWRRIFRRTTTWWCASSPSLWPGRISGRRQPVQPPAKPAPNVERERPHRRGSRPTMRQRPRQRRFLLLLNRATTVAPGLPR